MAPITSRLRGVATEQEIRQVVDELATRGRDEVIAISHRVSEVATDEVLPLVRSLLGIDAPEKASFSEPEATTGDSPEEPKTEPKTRKKAGKTTNESAEAPEGS